MTKKTDRPETPEEPMRFAQMVLGLEDTLPARHHLTPQEARFVTLYCRDLFRNGKGRGAEARMSQGEAARLAGFGGPNATQGSLSVTGSRIANRPRVKAAMAEYARFLADELSEDMVRDSLVTALKMALGEEPVRRTVGTWTKDGEYVRSDEMMYVGDPGVIRAIAETVARIKQMFTDRVLVGPLSHEQAIAELEQGPAPLEPAPDKYDDQV